MRAIIFSDSHGDISHLEDAIKHYGKPEYRFGLGDYEVDDYVLDVFGVTGVRGNSWSDPSWPYTMLYENEGFRILLTHGHRFSVKGGLYYLDEYCKNNNIDICFYGHTHEASIKRIGNITFINPGSCGMPSYPPYPTLCYMEINGGIANIKIVDAIDYSTYKEITIDKNGK